MTLVLPLNRQVMTIGQAAESENIDTLVPAAKATHLRACRRTITIRALLGWRARGYAEAMFEVTVEDSFAAGHYLRNYKGKCENPHGHNYKIRVTLAGEELDKAGLLLDFKDLREVMKHVIDRLDHQMINDLEPFTQVNPSAENLAKYFYEEANAKLHRVTNGRVRIRKVTVFETDTTTATYWK